MSESGRNAPCPCGSGKKHKNCCLGRREEPGTELGRLAFRLNATETHVFERLFEWSRRRMPSRWAQAAYDEVLLGEPMDEGDAQFYVPWLFYHCALEGASPATRYAAEMGERLSGAERQVIERYTGSWLSLWEVRRIDAGVGLELYDLLSHKTRFVHDVRASRDAALWCVVLGYVVDYPEVSVFGGFHPKPLAPNEAEPLLAAARRLLRVRTRPVAIERLRKPETEIALIRLWEATLVERDDQLLDPPLLRNTDGDPILLCTDHFKLDVATAQDVLRRISALEGAIPDAGTGKERVVIFSKPGNRMHSGWDNTTIGKAILRSHRLLIETNSVARADALRDRIEAAAAGLIQRLSRSVEDPRAALKGEPEAREQNEPDEEPRDPQDLALIREFIERHYETWPDHELPALGGLTPRVAAQRPEMRRRLVSLLKQMESHEGRKSDAERYDFGRLWRALGLEAERAGTLAPR